ncbi:MAG: hypothetical protein C5B57_13010 [Blastocatellia bacterium]|nr:MAG: hypothetical protein C5B57_13010 [Blastocatellia bacterium]
MQRLESPSSERALVAAVVCVLIVFRVLVYLLFEQMAFDSDQAIVGLMAKHLSQGRAFPLFFYGQTYMLGVEAWAAVPFFLLAGPTVVALRCSILAWNLAFGLLLVEGLRSDGQLRPWVAVVPALFFVAAPASVTSQLMNAQGGIIEPFVYFALLWFLRRRPLWFGALLAVGFRNREFTLYAVPVLLALELLTRELDYARIRQWLIAGVMFFAVWESIEALKRFADLLGPGTRGQLLGGFSGSQLGNLLNRFNWQAGSPVERVTSLGPQILAWLVGAGQAETNLPLGPRPWLVWVAGLGIFVGVVRLLTLLVPLVAERYQRESRGEPSPRLLRAQFPLYMLGIGAVAIVAFVAGKPFLSGYSRYVIAGLLFPVGLTAAILSLEPRVLLRRIVIVAAIAWGFMTVVDHGRVLVSYIRHPPKNAVREVADRLVARHVPVAAAGYWRAYLVTFLTDERVRVASRDFVRIQEYQDLFADRLRDAVVISESACLDGERVAGWYLCKP